VSPTLHRRVRHSYPADSEARHHGTPAWCCRTCISRRFCFFALGVGAGGLVARILVKIPAPAAQSSFPFTCCCAIGFRDGGSCSSKLALSFQWLVGDGLGRAVMVMSVAGALGSLLFCCSGRGSDRYNGRRGDRRHLRRSFSAVTFHSRA